MLSTGEAELIRQYFFEGYTYDEIILLLHSRHSISLSTRTLYRNLRRLGLRRRHRTSPQTIALAYQAVQTELHGSGMSLGYRTMTSRLANTHGITVSRHLVSTILRETDPQGVEDRQKRVFVRRTYINKGPNYLIHVDGYDKLKRFGFPIHGAIDGYSRRILWLHTAVSNNNPNIVATFFLQLLRQLKGVPRCIRMDCGTENILLEDIQKAFRREHTDDMADEKSVIKGSSHSNQRIERWWRFLRQEGCEFWMNLFASMENEGLLSTSDPAHIETIRFCFTDLIQRDLDRVKIEWNSHRIRPCRSVSPSGKPDLMYYIPSLFDGVDYKVDVCMDDLENVTASKMEGMLSRITGYVFQNHTATRTSNSLHCE